MCLKVDVHGAHGVVQEVMDDEEHESVLWDDIDTSTLVEQVHSESLTNSDLQPQVSLISLP